jgi:methylated-DNA-[protein]-cysteine S-methyltransferase
VTVAGRERALATAWMNTPVGVVRPWSDGAAIVQLDLLDDVPAGEAMPPGRCPVLAQAIEELREYFLGERRAFTVPVAGEGTAFARRVWTELARIPWGTTISYGELARRAGVRGGARAVGAANGRNPVPILVPCHRVIGADGSMTGYSGGMWRKRVLLALEGLALEGAEGLTA